MKTETEWPTEYESRNIFKTSLMQNEKNDDTKRNPLGERCHESVQKCLKVIENVGIYSGEKVRTED